ncbi:MAG TPA: class I tRNA ligase family protein, partial [Candidatus Goldiibacteriota bacterium]|nr:class I tRNA ligase family protein [Candidatus Goldiibacteriota bacterium]
AAVGFRGKAPFKSVISHGWILDGQGRAMHKSLGNVINPLDLIKKGGADVLRLWVASEDFTADQSISEEIMSRVTDSYRRIRNTFRYMLSAVNDFKKENAVPYEKLSAFDKYALHRMQVLLDSLDKYYERFEFHRVYREFTNLCSTFLSSYYFDVLKDRLYTFKSNGIERRGAQTVIYKMLINLTKAIAPVLAFTADEVWQFIPQELKNENHIQLEKWTNEKEPLLSDEEVQGWEIFNKLRDAALKKIEDKRKEKILNHPYEAVINISYASAKLDRILKKLSKEEVEQMIIVSGVSYSPAGKLEDKEWDFGLEITAGKSDAVKCERCWRYTDTTGSNPEYPGLCSRCVENLG